MAFADLLPHTGTILRRAAGADRFGQPHIDRTSAVGTFSCRLTKATGSESFTERSQDVIRAYYWLYYPDGVDLHEDDDLKVTDEDGNVVLAAGNVVVVGHVAGYSDTHHRRARVMAVRPSTS